MTRKPFAWCGGIAIAALCQFTPLQASYNESLTQSVTTAGSTTSQIQGQIDPTNSAAQRFLGIPYAAEVFIGIEFQALASTGFEC
jgi:hypothetical protein